MSVQGLHEGRNLTYYPQWPKQILEKLTSRKVDVKINFLRVSVQNHHEPTRPRCILSNRFHLSSLTYPDFPVPGFESKVLNILNMDSTFTSPVSYRSPFEFGLDIRRYQAFVTIYPLLKVGYCLCSIKSMASCYKSDNFA